MPLATGTGFISELNELCEITRRTGDRDMKIESGPNALSAESWKCGIFFPPSRWLAAASRGGGAGKQIGNFILLCLCFWHTGYRRQAGISYLQAAWLSSGVGMDRALLRTN